MNLWGRPLVFAAALLACSSCVSTAEPRWPESLGTIPDDLPLPPGMPLDPGRESWLGSAGGGRKAGVFLAGDAQIRDVSTFFSTHFRLARWKPVVQERPDPGVLVFSKDGETARIVLQSREEGGTRVQVLLNSD